MRSREFITLIHLLPNVTNATTAQVKDTSVSCASSTGCVEQKRVGRIVQGTHCARGGTSETFLSGTHRSVTLHHVILLFHYHDVQWMQGCCVPDRCVPDQKFLDFAPLEQSVPWLLCP
jgi:hypothetical protein